MEPGIQEKISPPAPIIVVAPEPRPRCRPHAGRASAQFGEALFGHYWVAGIDRTGMVAEDGGDALGWLSWGVPEPRKMADVGVAATIDRAPLDATNGRRPHGPSRVTARPL